MNPMRYAPLFPGSNAPLRRPGPPVWDEPPSYNVSVPLPRMVRQDRGEVDDYEADWEGHDDPVVAALRRELRLYAYKPGFRLEIIPGAASYFERGPALGVHAKVPDSRGRKGRDGGPKIVKVGGQYPVPPPILEVTYGPPEDREREFCEFLGVVLQQFEDHELFEWFRRDGKLVNDPHQTKG